jgi:methionyl-tRNA synthetase
MNTIIYVALELIRKVTILLYPIIPDSSLKVLGIFGINEDHIKFETIKENNYLKKDFKLNKLNILFKKIEKND